MAAFDAELEEVGGRAKRAEAEAKEKVERAERDHARRLEEAERNHEVGE